MNYIGSKLKLSSFLFDTITTVVDSNLKEKIFCDLFAGTGIVGRTFKTKVKFVISNDIEYYSYVLNRNYIGNHTLFDYKDLIDELNSLKGTPGKIFNEYSENGKAGRLYFSENNGKKIDAIRVHIETLLENQKISTNQYFFLLASLLENADKVANTASVYGAFLKKIKKTASTNLQIIPALFETTQKSHQVFNEDANTLIKKIKGDILYLDPPYNQREYGANYHLLNTIARYDSFSPKGVTGLREYARSNYCRKNEVAASFEYLIQNADFEYIFLSYNNEGLMAPELIKSILKKFGKYQLFTKNYQRFKADKTENRVHKAENTTEFLHVIIKK